MKRISLSWLLLGSLLYAQQPIPKPASTQAPSFIVANEFSADKLRAHVSFLADDKQEGRFTGSAGIGRAATYITQQLQALGLKPAKGQAAYTNTFEYMADLKPGGHPTQLAFAGKQSGFVVDRDISSLAFTSSETVSGELIFAGYGLSVPGGYNSFEGIDLKDKVVLMFRGIPEGVPATVRAELNRYADLRFKAANARSKGAKAVLVVNPPVAPYNGELIPIRFDRVGASSGLVALSVTAKTANELLAPASRTLQQLYAQMDTARSAPKGFTVPGVTLTASGGVTPIVKTDNNVIAYLPPTVPGSDEYVMIGAHYDHLGLGHTGSLARVGEAEHIHNGADDNASGVAAVLELAARMARQPERKRGLLIAFWSGEELGLLGSAAYANKPLMPLDKCGAYLNFDMVGRLTNNKLQVQGLGSSADWKILVTEFNRIHKFDLALGDDPYLPTDVTSFYPKGVPVLAFFTGTHDDYHRPTDDSEQLNYAGMQNICAYAANIADHLLNDNSRPTYGKVERNTTAMGRSGGPMRVSIGTIPDYAYQGQGLKLAGVRGGSPAEKAGLKEGDIVTGLAGQSIKNIYDYMNILGGLRGGEAIKATVDRAGKQVELTVTPEARNP